MGLFGVDKSECNVDNLWITGWGMVETRLVGVDNSAGGLPIYPAKLFHIP